MVVVGERMCAALTRDLNGFHILNLTSEMISSAFPLVLNRVSHWDCSDESHELYLLLWGIMYHCCLVWSLLEANQCFLRFGLHQASRVQCGEVQALQVRLPQRQNSIKRPSFLHLILLSKTIVFPDHCLYSSSTILVAEHLF